MFSEMTDMFTAAINRGIGRHEITLSQSAASAAADIVAHMEGLMVMAKAKRDPELLRGLGATAQRLLQ